MNMIVVLGWICTGYFVYCILSTTHIKPTYTSLDYIPRRHTREDFDKFTREMDSIFTYCNSIRPDTKVARKCKFKRGYKENFSSKRVNFRKFQRMINTEEE